MSDERLGDDELAELERLEQAATAGPWYPHATDDEVFMNARYVSTEPGPTVRRVKLPDGEHVIDVGKWTHDGAQGMADGNEDQAQSDKVVAVTLLQAPRLADPDQCDENTELIAALRNAAPRLLADLRAARAERDAALDEHVQMQARLQRVIDGSLAHEQRGDRYRARALALRRQCVQERARSIAYEHVVDSLQVVGLRNKLTAAEARNAALAGLLWEAAENLKSCWGQFASYQTPDGEWHSSNMGLSTLEDLEAFIPKLDAALSAQPAPAAADAPGEKGVYGRWTIA